MQGNILCQKSLSFYCNNALVLIDFIQYFWEKLSCDNLSQAMSQQGMSYDLDDSFSGMTTQNVDS